MPLYRAVWAFPATSALPEDECSWSTTFSAADDAVAIAAEAFMDLFVIAPPAGVGGDTLGQFLSNSLASMETKVSRVGAPKGTPPIVQTVGIPLPGRSNVNDLPGEIACCLSQKTTNVGVSAGPRDRGRMYIGPFNFGAIDGSFRPGRINQSLINVMRDAAIKLHDDWDLAGADWVVHSRIRGSGLDVLSGWVDQEPDYIGKRGLRTKVRTTWSF